MSRSRRPPRDDVALPATRARITRAVDDELQSHLDERTAELMRSGLAREMALEQAHREFGDVHEASAELRNVDERAARIDQLAELVADLGTDLRRAARGLLRRPVFALTAIGTLALGIGANAVMFGLIDRLLLSPPAAVRDADRIVRLRYDVGRDGGGRISWVRAPYPAYQHLAARRDLFEGVAAYSDRALTMAVGAQARELTVAATTPNYFSVLGVSTQSGRVLDDDDGDDRSVVISHALWIQIFGGSPNALGRRVQLGGEPFTIVGIAPVGFTGDGIEPFDAWIRLSDATPTVGRGWATAAQARILFVFARLQAGVSPASAAQEASRVYRGSLADAQTPDSTARVEFRSLLAGRDTDGGALTPSAKVALWLQGVSILVLIIAVANVMNLLLLRAMDRQRETAVCLALGVTRLRLIRHLSLESFLLAIAGSVAAVALAVWLGPSLWKVVVPQASDIAHVSRKLTTVAVGSAVVCALLMTLAPAFVQRAWSGTDALRSGSRTVTRRTSIVGDVLVVVQVSLTVVLLVGAGLFTRSMDRLQNVDLGFRPEQITGARLSTPVSMDTATRTALFARVEETLRRLPRVEAVASGQSAPFRPSLTTYFRLPGHEALPGVGQNALGFPTFFAVSPDYLPTLGVRVLRGRGITSADRAGAARVMLVDATMARTFWPNTEPIGRCVQLVADSLPCTTVVGVVEDTKRGLTETRHSLRFYLPIEQSPFRLRERYFFVRTTRSNPQMADGMRAAIAATAPSAPYVEAFPVERLLDVYTQQWRLGTTAFVAFGVLATVVAAIGLFGVISFGVARRERELGIRRALGQPRGSIVRNIVRGATLRSAIGLGIGGLLSVALSRRLRELLFRPDSSDIAVFGVVVAIVLVVTAVASAGPAARAMRADPMRALRAE